jgi:hypothetical protein
MSKGTLSAAGARRLARQRHHYARRMLDARRGARLPLFVVEEWDFRTIHLIELRHFLNYEGEREDRAFVQAADNWLSSTFRSTTVCEFLLRHQELRRPELVALSRGCPFAKELRFTWLLDFPLFPAPWLFFEFEDRLAWARRWEWRVILKPMPEVHPKLEPEERLEWMSHGYYFSPNPTANFKENVRAFAKLFAPLWATREHRVTGKAAASPWHLSKRLAARRLARTGMGFEEARRHVLQYAKDFPMENPAPVLPLYETRSAWDRVVK